MSMRDAPLWEAGIAGLAAAALAVAWMAAKSRRRSSKRVTSELEPLRLAEADVRRDHLRDAAPYLELMLTFQNASGYPLREIATRGHLTVNGKQFQRVLEFKHGAMVYGVDDFIRVGLKAPTSASEVEHVDLAVGDLLVEFSDVVLTFHVAQPGKGEMLNVRIPSIRFNRQGRADQIVQMQPHQ